MSLFDSAVAKALSGGSGGSNEEIAVFEGSFSYNHSTGEVTVEVFSNGKAIYDAWESGKAVLINCPPVRFFLTYAVDDQGQYTFAGSVAWRYANTLHNEPLSGTSYQSSESTLLTGRAEY